MSKNILVVAAHADDETLGCGATLAKHIAEGDKVTIVWLTDGVSARQNSETNDSQTRQTAADKAMSTLGVSDIHSFAFPDNQLDSVPLLKIVQAIEGVIEQVQPERIYTHFPHDLNVDHRIAHSAVMTACRPQVGSHVRSILTFEVLSSTEWNSALTPEFKPQYVVDITPYWQQKLDALSCYHQELRAFPHSRSLECIEALATLRGATHGFAKAEAFMVERMLVN